MIQEIVRKPLRPSVKPLKKSMKFLISPLPSIRKRRSLMNVARLIPCEYLERSLYYEVRGSGPCFS